MKNYLEGVKNCFIKIKIFLAKNSPLTAIFALLLVLVFILYGWKWLLAVLFISAFISYVICDYQTSKEKEQCGVCKEYYYPQKLNSMRNCHDSMSVCRGCIKEAENPRGYKLVNPY